VVDSGWMTNEMLGDTPNAGGTWLAVADSVLLFAEQSGVNITDTVF